MEQVNLSAPVIKVNDTIYETYDSYDNLHKRKVEKNTKTQIILNNGKKLRNKPLRIYGNREIYNLNPIRNIGWNNTHYYIETEELVKQYNHEQLFLKTKKIFESLDLKKLTNEQLNTLLSTINQINIK